MLEDEANLTDIVLMRHRDLAEHRVSELSGMLTGMTIGRRRGRGMKELGQWIEEHEAVWQCDGVAELREALAPAMESGEVSISARANIENAIHRISPYLHRQCEHFSSFPDVHYDAGPADLNGRVVFTGVFVSTTRERAARITANLGAQVQSNVAMCTDLLIVGTRCHPAWKHARRGRKIEKIVRWRSERRTRCRITDESTWAEAVIAAAAVLKSRHNAEQQT